MVPMRSQRVHWGRHGAHQVPQDRFKVHFGIPNDPKMKQHAAEIVENAFQIDQNESQIDQNGILGLSGSPLADEQYIGHRAQFLHNEVPRVFLQTKKGRRTGAAT